MFTFTVQPVTILAFLPFYHTNNKPMRILISGSFLQVFSFPCHKNIDVELILKCKSQQANSMIESIFVHSV